MVWGLVQPKYRNTYGQSNTKRWNWQPKKADANGWVNYLKVVGDKPKLWDCGICGYQGNGIKFPKCRNCKLHWQDGQPSNPVPPKYADAN